MHQIIQPQEWAPPRGYSNGVIARGQELVFIGGQIGWNLNCEFESDDFVSQVSQALSNIVTILQEAGCDASQIVRMTWYITDKSAYRDNLKQIGQVYRKIIGRYFPPMSVVVVNELIEDRAKVEIEATAVK